MKSIIKKSALLLALFITSIGVQAQSSDQIVKDVTVVKLSQTPGEYDTEKLNLKPGKYIFEVTNANVDKELGFWLTPEGKDDKQVPSSGLSKLVAKGETARSGVVELKSGSYSFSCPLNPTPKYQIKVSSK